MSEIILYDYWRSSASYRVRIALNSLGLKYQTVPVNLLERAHKTAEHLSRNPQGLVPALKIDGLMMTQSLSIIEYLAETRDASGFLPLDPVGCQRVRAFSYAIAMDIHPVCNLGVVGHVMELTGGGEAVRTGWMRKFIGEGLSAVERMLDDPRTGSFCHGDVPTMADICLVPQVYNAERWGADISGFSRICRITAACAELPAFKAAHPDAVKPAG
ncbi:maleylacetoacetate isomerase [Rhizobium sp. ARZ01]|uniref:maleylacetoacetate isomerase n=1 Tax=Rhizobium sp. ARZ01 TaxID=2769313 RepID=UPI00177D6DC8|nr:maleylacetoacetate isomerase [Rhizobium sp. ARZ01]MBD9375140.1 maleylacetoacetate isomerase [Rhizobium sp. ARZ01]